MLLIKRCPDKVKSTRASLFHPAVSCRYKPGLITSFYDLVQISMAPTPESNDQHSDLKSVRLLECFAASESTIFTHGCGWAEDVSQLSGLLEKTQRVHHFQCVISPYPKVYTRVAGGSVGTLFGLHFRILCSIKSLTELIMKSTGWQSLNPTGLVAKTLNWALCFPSTWSLSLLHQPSQDHVAGA